MSSAPSGPLLPGSTTSWKWLLGRDGRRFVEVDLVGGEVENEHRQTRTRWLGGHVFWCGSSRVVHHASKVYIMILYSALMVVF